MGCCGAGADVGEELADVPHRLGEPVDGVEDVGAGHRRRRRWPGVASAVEGQREEGEVEAEVAVEVQGSEGAEVESGSAHAEAVQADQPRPILRAVLEQRRPGDAVDPVAEEPLGSRLLGPWRIAVEPGQAREPQVARAASAACALARRRRVRVVGLRARAASPRCSNSARASDTSPSIRSQQRRIGTARPRRDEAVGGGVDEDVASHARRQARVGAGRPSRRAVAPCRVSSTAGSASAQRSNGSCTGVGLPRSRASISSARASLMRVGDLPRVLEQVGVGGEPEVESVDVAEQRDVQAGEGEQHAGGVDARHLGAAGVDRERRPGDVRHHDVGDAGHAVGDVGRPGGPRRQVEQERRCHLADRLDLPRPDGLGQLLGRLGAGVDGLHPLDRVVDVGGQRRTHGGDLVGVVVVVGEAGGHRDLGGERTAASGMSPCRSMWLRSAPETRPSTTSLTLTPSASFTARTSSRLTDANELCRCGPTMPLKHGPATPSAIGFWLRCWRIVTPRPAVRSRYSMSFRGVWNVGISARTNSSRSDGSIDPGVARRSPRSRSRCAAPGSARGRRAARRARRPTRRPSGSGGTW